VPRDKPLLQPCCRRLSAGCCCSRCDANNSSSRIFVVGEGCASNNSSRTRAQPQGVEQQQCKAGVSMLPGNNPVGCLTSACCSGVGSTALTGHQLGSNNALEGHLLSGLNQGAHQRSLLNSFLDCSLPLSGDQQPLMTGTCCWYHCE
jgi:hypothetical protein